LRIVGAETPYSGARPLPFAPFASLSRIFCYTASPSFGYTEIRTCGIVDGKNSFGGYAGGSRFVSVSRSYKDTFDNFIVELDNSSASDKAAAERIGSVTSFEKVCWNEYCVDEAHPALVPAT
jgi:hypothetical protein